MCSNANVAVAQQAVNRASHTEHNNVHTMNNREWKDEEYDNNMSKLERTTKRKEFQEQYKGLMDQWIPKNKKNSLKSGIQWHPVYKRRMGKRNRIWNAEEYQMEYRNEDSSYNNWWGRMTKG